MQQNIQQAQGWHTADWGTWGWIETIIKLVGAFAGIAAFVTAPMTDFILDGNPRLAAVIVVALTTLLLFAVLFIRFRQREIVSMLFAVLSFAGHAALLIALLRAPELTTLPLIFAGGYILGELAKQQFIRSTGFTEAGQTVGGMINFSRGVLLIYVVLAVFLII